MTGRFLVSAAASAVLAFVGPSVEARAGTISGVTADGTRWQARSMIVGVTSTATLAAFGDPIYQPSLPTSSGMVALTMFRETSISICSGTLLPDRVSVLTAAHCVSDGGADRPLRTSAAFYGGSNGDLIVTQSVFSTRRDVRDYTVHPDYTGDVFDQNDIAILRLRSPAPEFAQSFGLFTGDLASETFNVWGYGRRAEFGGAVGADLNGGRLRQGLNRFDIRLGDPLFGDHWAAEFGEPLEQIEELWLSDFDNGLAANDAACLALAARLPAVGSSPAWCDLGLGAREVAIAGGDSGGPSFIDGLVAAISSFGVTYADPALGDVDTRLNSSFGEFSGFVPVGLHAAFIEAALVPEPGGWAAMSLGLLAVGAGRRRRRRERGADGVPGVKTMQETVQ